MISFKTIQKSTSGAYYTIFDSEDKVLRTYGLNTYEFVAEPDGVSFSLEARYNNLSYQFKSIDNFPYTRVINGDTGVIFASFAAMQAYILANCFIGTGGGSGVAVWGAITGTLSSQTDLQTALNGKQNSLGFTPYNATNPAGYISGNQTITLSGDVTGSGATSITTSIGAGVVTNGMLAGAIAASKLVGTDISTIGTLVAGSVPYSLVTGGPSALPPSGAAGGDLSGTYPNPSVNQINSITKTYYDPTSSIQTQLNNKQSALSGTGFVKIAGTTISYDNSTYLTTSSATSTYLPFSGGTLTGFLTLNADPTSSLHAATKSYVDNFLTGITWKQEVVAATTANITLSGAQTIDGVSVIAGNRVLVKNQTSQVDNGIYLAASGGWTRTTDADSGAEIGSATVLIRNGTVNKDTQWTCTNSTDPVIGTDNITFGQIAGAGVYTNGSGITLTGNVFSIGTGAVTNAMLAGSITNANLSNSTISGIALGSSLAALTATNASLTFSGSYDGSTARTVGLNLANANTWTAALTVSLATAASATYGATLMSTTPATVGAQKWSPFILFQGNGWGTTGGATTVAQGDIGLIPIQNGSGQYGTMVIRATTIGTSTMVTLATFDPSGPTFFPALDVTMASSATLSVNAIKATANNGNITLQSGRTFNTAAQFILFNPGQVTNSSGTVVGIDATQTLNQSGSAAYTGYRMNLTETAVISGNVKFVDYQIASVSKFSIDDTGLIKSNIGTSTKSHTVGGKIKEYFTDAGNTTTTETDLYTYTTEASILGANGASIQAEYGGAFVSSATATRELKVYFGGTVLFDSGALTISTTAQWAIYVSLIRVSATVIRYMISLSADGVTLTAPVSAGELTGLTLSATNILKITGQAAATGAATNDIVAKLGAVYYWPVSI